MCETEASAVQGEGMGSCSQCTVVKKFTGEKGFALVVLSKPLERLFAVTNLITFWLFLTLYSCGNVIVIVIVHFINNWFMMILVAVYVYLKINAIKSLSLQTEREHVLH